ncbi:DivIVA domain-containing protein [Frigoribacterium sp. 2-23]|uniref:DivIVA domain-containing protein n=1 Tax=Frigoribacterium sp. 2-23 TaxID=3415006 RepID=UPI003C6F1FE3
MVPVSSTFPKAPRGQRGYDMTEVDAFLSDARRAYTGEGGVGESMDSAFIRRTAFTMRKDGYSTAHVDSALERLEDAFANREREKALSSGAETAWYGDARGDAEAIVARLDRPAGHRFDRVSFLTTGYHPRDVDRLVKRLQGYFTEGKPLSIDDVRSSVFRARRGGYREAQVDVLLDGVVDVMLAVR